MHAEGSGAWSRDKAKLISAGLGLLGLGIVALVGMVLRHETQLAVIGADVQQVRQQVSEMRSDVRQLLQQGGK